MISNVDIKRMYVNLYKCLRNYFWDYGFVRVLVDLEDACLRRFPNMKDVRRLSLQLYNMCSDTRKQDEELQSSFDKFRKTVENNDCEYAYVPLNVK